MTATAIASERAVAVRSALTLPRSELHPDGRMVTRPIPRPRLAINHRRRAARLQRRAEQHEIDAQAEVAAETGRAVIPPAEMPGLLVVQAEAVVQAEVGETAQR